MMIVYLDSVVVIYAVQGPAPFRQRALDRRARSRDDRNEFRVSDLTWLECRVKPLRLRHSDVLRDLDDFFTQSDLVQVELPFPVYERAAEIRAVHRYGLADSLHLAAAIHFGCDVFLTNDRRLDGFTDLPAEVLA